MTLKNCFIIALLLISGILIVSSSNKNKELAEHQTNSQYRQNNINRLKKQILKIRPTLYSTLAREYGRLISLNCRREVQDHMVAIFYQESRYKAYAKNHDDWGLGQINARTWKKFFGIKSKKELLNPILNIHLSCKILEMAYDTHSNHIDWYGYYHSWNSIPRKEYVKKIDKIMRRQYVN
jgi:hypothetical protein